MSDEAGMLEARRQLVRRDLAMGQYFRAFDRARAALAIAPDDLRLSLMQATALARTGATAEARAVIARFDPLLDAIDTEHPDGEHKALLADSETVDMLGRIYRASWREMGEVLDLRRARDLDLARFHLHGQLVDGANAAVLCRTLHEIQSASALAGAALAAHRGAATDDDGVFAEHLAAAEASILLGKTAQAEREVRLASGLARLAPERGVLARRRLADLKALGVAVPDTLFAHLKPPTVVIFAGAPAYAPGDAAVALPPEREAVLALQLDELLAELDATIGYSSLAAGGDILFAEAMLKRGGEVNVVLPFEEADFIARRVAPAGERWAERYHALRSKVADVTPVCHDLYLGHDVLLRFANQVIDGRARLRATALDTAPTLIAAWDYLAEPSPGSPSDFIDHWGDPSHLRVIDMAALRDGPDDDAPSAVGAGAGAGAGVALADAPRSLAHEPPLPAPGPEQTVLAMLFADVVGYSTIQDQHLPSFWAYLAKVRQRIGERLSAAIHVASWGDAIFIATPKAGDLATIAVGLTEAFETEDARAMGLPARLRLRTGLHAGTAFIGKHPLSHEKVLYGGAVNRAARIEPITVPGRIYASEQFVALLASEYSAQAVEARMTGEPVPPPFRYSYRGELSLAKNYGRQAVYEITPPTRPLQQALIAVREDVPVTAHFSLQLANEMTEYTRLTADLAAWADEHKIDPAIVTTFEIAFDEVLANIVTYAYDDEGHHTIDVSCVWDGDTLSAQVIDDGRPFDPLAQEAPDLEKTLEERTVGGLGLFLVREMMDVVAYARKEGKNILSFAKRANG